METKELNSYPDLKSFDSRDKIFAYSESLNSFGFLPASIMAQTHGYACRRWNVNNASPVGEAVGDIDYLRNLPSLLGLGCYLVNKNHGRKKLDPTNHYKFATGEPASLDGSMGDYMWGWGAKWYYAWWVEGNYYYEAASLAPIRGKLNYVIPVASTSAIGGSVVDRELLELVSVVNVAGRYRGGNNNAALDEAFNTQLGRVATSLSTATFGAYARKKGQGWEAFWYAHSAAVGILSRIILGTRHIQTAYNSNKDSNGLYQGGLGAGVTGAGAWWNGSGEGQFKAYPFLPTDVGVELGDACGVVSYAVPGSGGETLSTVTIPVFFGLKNPFGYMMRWERGRLISKNADGSGDVYVVPQLHSDYDMNSLAGLVKAATLPATSNAGYEYIIRLSMQNLCHTPTVVGGSSSTYYADALYNDNATSGLRVPAVGGHASNGSYAGFEYVYANLAVSTSAAYFGSPLCEAEENWDTTPVLVS
jgi:hypothetical protein